MGARIGSFRPAFRAVLTTGALTVAVAACSAASQASHGSDASGAGANAGAAGDGLGGSGATSGTSDSIGFGGSSDAARGGGGAGNEGGLGGTGGTGGPAPITVGTTCGTGNYTPIVCAGAAPLCQLMFSTELNTFTSATCVPYLAVNIWTSISCDEPADCPADQHCVEGDTGGWGGSVGCHPYDWHPPLTLREVCASPTMVEQPCPSGRHCGDPVSPRGVPILPAGWKLCQLD